MSVFPPEFVFPSNEYRYFCLCSRHVHHQPGNSGISLVAVAQKPTHFHEFVGCCQVVFFGMVLFGVGAVAEEFWTLPKIISWTFWLGVITLGVFVTVISFSFYFISVDSIGPTKTAIFINLVPIFGTCFSAFFLQEQIYWTFLVGLLLVIIGIFIINLPKQAILKEDCSVHTFK